MKNFTKHFTTPEQSKRLLELGVPADSADMYYHLANHQYYVRDEFSIKQHDFFKFYKNIFYPCWSVGRLIEIYLICNEKINKITELHHSACKISVREHSVLDEIIEKIEYQVGKYHMDFSKLEE